MTTLVPVFTLLFGVLIGCATSWFLFLPRERALARAGIASELHIKDTVINNLESRMKSQDACLLELNKKREEGESRLIAEVRGRTAAEQQCSQVAPLQLKVDKLTEAEKLLNEDITRLRIEAERAKADLKGEREKVAHLDDAERKLSDVFNTLASRALRANNQSFLGLANEKFETIREAAKAELDGRKAAFDQTVSPIKECLEKVDRKIQQLEVARQGAYQELQAQVHELKGGQSQLTMETKRLVGALRSPNIRGSWGELQLKQIAELAGMLENCDFLWQKSLDGDDGKLRPDMIVKLAGGRSIAVDAKAPLAAYLQAIDADNEDHCREKMKEHAKHVRGHITALGRKEYWGRLQPSPEFVILFLPGEVIYTAALQHDPDLIAFGSGQNVIISTSNTLIGLLRAIAYGWNQEVIARQAEDIKRLGQELYKRIGTLGSHAQAARKGLNSAVESYNQFIGSLESQVLTQARRFRDYKIGGDAKEIHELVPIESTVRAIVKPELQGTLWGQNSLDTPESPAN